MKPAGLLLACLAGLLCSAQCSQLSQSDATWESLLPSGVSGSSACANSSCTLTLSVAQAELNETIEVDGWAAVVVEGGTISCSADHPAFIMRGISSVEMKSVAVSNCTGAFVLPDGGQVVSLTDSTFVGLSSRALHMDNSKLAARLPDTSGPAAVTIEGCTFEDVQTRLLPDADDLSVLGGAVLIEWGTSAQLYGAAGVRVSSSNFTGCYADSGGGSIAVHHTAPGDDSPSENRSVSIDDCSFLKSSTGEYDAFSRGEYTIETGGAIQLKYPGEVVIAGSTFDDCVSANDTSPGVSWARGPAGAVSVRVDGSSFVMEVTESAFSRTRATEGGALHIASDEDRTCQSQQVVTVSNTTFTDNVVRSGSGGAVLFENECGSLVVKGSRFESNAATEEVIAGDAYGGAIHVQDAHAVSITDGCTFRSNSADHGGAVSLTRVRFSAQGDPLVVPGAPEVSDDTSDFRESAYIADAVFEANNAFITAGAVYLDNCGKTTLFGCRLTNNTAALQAGAVGATRFTQQDRLQMSQCTFERNRALQAGGAIHMAEGLAGLFVFNSTFAGNAAEGFSTTEGGAIYHDGRSLTAYDTEMIYSTDPHFEDQREYVHTTFQDPSVSGLVVRLDGCDLEDNSAGRGGAVHVDVLPTFRADDRPPIIDIVRSTFVNNTATSDVGGAVSVRLELVNSILGTLYISGSLFENNSAMSRGGAVFVGEEAFVKLGVTDISFSTFVNNTVIEAVTPRSSGLGGAIYHSERGTFAGVFNSFTGNKASAAGGALYIKSAAPTWEDVQVWYPSRTWIAHSVFHSNSATSDSGVGGGLAVLGRWHTYMHCNAFQGNDAAREGGAAVLFPPDAAYVDAETRELGRSGVLTAYEALANLTARRPDHIPENLSESGIISACPVAGSQEYLAAADFPLSYLGPLTPPPPPPFPPYDSDYPPYDYSPDYYDSPAPPFDPYYDYGPLAPAPPSDPYDYGPPAAAPPPELPQLDGYTGGGSPLSWEELLGQYQCKCDACVEAFGPSMLASTGELPSMVLLYDNFWASNTAGRSGGALGAAMQPMCINGDVFEDNIAGVNGGAVAGSYLPHVSLAGVRMEGNEAGFIEAAEGGLSHGGGALSLSLAVAPYLPAAYTFLLSGSSFIDNRAQGGGGALHLEATTLRAGGGSLKLLGHDGVLMDGNNATLGGGMYLEADGMAVHVSTIEMEGNTAERDGGAVAAATSVEELRIEDCLFWNNTALMGGAVYARPKQAEVLGCAVRGNAAQAGGSSGMGAGGGMLFELPHPEPEQAPVAPSRRLSQSSISRLDLQDLTVEGNAAASGAGLLVIGYDALSLDGSNITTNNAEGVGGGLLIRDCNAVNVTACELSDNSSGGAGGMAILQADQMEADQAQSIPQISLEDVTLLENVVSPSGESGAVNVTGCQFVGGGLCVDGRSTVLLKNITVAGNSADHAAGMSLYGLDGTSMVLTDTTFSDNTARLGDGSALLTNAQRNRVSAVCGDRSLKLSDPGAPAFLRSECGWSAPGDDQDLVGLAPEVLSVQLEDRLPVLLYPPDYTASSRRPNVVRVVFADASGAEYSRPWLYGHQTVTLGAEPELRLIEEVSFEVMGAYATVDLDAAGIAIESYDQYGLKYSLPLRSLDLTTTLELQVEGCVVGSGPVPVVFGCRECDAGRTNDEGPVFGRQECRVCPANGDCRFGGARFTPLDAFWHQHPLIKDVTLCPNKDACRFLTQYAAQVNSSAEYDSELTARSLHGYADGGCSVGYRGPLCGSCTEGYGHTSKYKCASCPNRWLAIFLVSLTLFLALLVFVAMHIKQRFEMASFRAARHEWLTRVAHASYLGTIFKLGINFMQLVSISKEFISSEWPASFDGLASGASTTSNVDLSAFISLRCISAGLSGFDGAMLDVLLRVLLALIFPAIFALIWVFGFFLFRKRSTQQVPFRAYLWGKVKTSSILLLWVLYQPVTQALLSVYSCVSVPVVRDLESSTRYTVPEVSRVLFWSKETTVECYEGKHLLLSLLLLPVTVAFCLGVPMLLWWRVGKLFASAGIRKAQEDADDVDMEMAIPEADEPGDEDTGSLYGDTSETEPPGSNPSLPGLPSAATDESAAFSLDARSPSASVPHSGAGPVAERKESPVLDVKITDSDGGDSARFKSARHPHQSLSGLNRRTGTLTRAPSMGLYRRRSTWDGNALNADSQQVVIIEDNVVAAMPRDLLKRMSNYLFLYQSYRIQFPYWESVVLLRKLCLVVAAQLLAPLGVYIQVLGTLMVIATFTVLQTWLRPYWQSVPAALDVITNASAAVMFMLGLIILGGDQNGGAAQVDLSSTSRNVLAVVIFLIFGGTLLVLILAAVLNVRRAHGSKFEAARQAFLRSKTKRQASRAGPPIETMPVEQSVED